MATSQSTLEATIRDLISALKPGAEANDLLANAKEGAMTANEASIRGFVARAAKINRNLDDDECDEVAGAVADALYTGSSAKVRKSELKTLLQTRAKLPEILTGMDNILAGMRSKDPKAVLNIRQHVLTAARMARKEPDATAKQIIADMKRKLVKAQPTPKDRARALIERVREMGELRTKVGDTEVVNEMAERAISVLIAVVEGETPQALGSAVEETEEYRALETETVNLRDEVEDLRKQLQAVVQGAAQAAMPATPAEPAGEPLGGDGVVWGGETPDLDEAAPEPADDAEETQQEEEQGETAPTSRDQSTSVSLTGLSVDDLLKLAQ